MTIEKAEAQARLDEIEKEAKALIASTDREDYQLGTLWNELVDRGWTKMAKSGSPRDWWTQHVPAAVDVRMAKLLGRLARTFTKDVVERYHATTLDLYLRYCEQEGVAPAADPGNHILRIPQGDHYVGKPFQTCTREDLRAALRAAPRAPKKEPRALPANERAFLTRAQSRLAPLFEGHPEAALSAHLRGATVVYVLSAGSDILRAAAAALAGLG